jgi:hypothetical protein
MRGLKQSRRRGYGVLSESDNSHYRAKRESYKGDGMALKVEFDHEGRTYAVESPRINMWRAHIIAKMNDLMTIETDLRTGDKIFVTWSEVGVIRLISSIDENGFAVD